MLQGTVLVMKTIRKCNSRDGAGRAMSKCTNRDKNETTCTCLSTDEYTKKQMTSSRHFHLSKVATNSVMPAPYSSWLERIFTLSGLVLQSTKMQHIDECLGSKEIVSQYSRGYRCERDMLQANKCLVGKWESLLINHWHWHTVLIQGQAHNMKFANWKQSTKEEEKVPNTRAVLFHAWWFTI